MKKWLMLGGGAIALVAVSVGVSMMFLKPPPAAEPAVAAAVAAEPPKTIYVPFRPEFIVNFGAAKRSRYLMVDVTVATQDALVPDIIETHMPELRNDLLMLFSADASEALYTEEGKKALRAAAMSTISRVLEKHHAADAVSDVFFTRFVMQ